MTPVIAYISVGSNVLPERHVRIGVEELARRYVNLCCSSVYRSVAVGFEGDDFINLPAVVETDLEPLGLRAWLRDLEDRYGRDRTQPRYSDRTLDIDILLYDDLYLLSPELEIPRDEILTAAHVLKPLADLAPDVVHPVARRTMAQLWSEFPEKHPGLEPIDL